MTNLIIGRDAWPKENMNCEKIDNNPKLSEQTNGLYSAELRESMTQATHVVHQLCNQLEEFSTTPLF